MKGRHSEFSESRDDIPLAESGGDDILDEQKAEYPSLPKLAPIILGLCSQSFCIALVSLARTYIEYRTLTNHEIG